MMRWWSDRLLGGVLGSVLGAGAVLVTTPVAAQIDESVARTVYARYCLPDRAAVPGTPFNIDRLTFEAAPGRPALLILCEDRERMALEVALDSTDLGLAFMAYRPFAPFWPAAEARWGTDLSILREEVRAAPIDALLAANPYGPQMERRLAEAITRAKVAREIGDHDRARQLLEGEIEHIEQARGRKPKSKRYGFELSLILSDLAYLAADLTGPAAGADRLKALAAQHPVPDRYRQNIDLNHAGLLAEAGRAEEAIAVIAPYLANQGLDPAKGRAAETEGAAQRFDWVMACALTRQGASAAAAPFIAAVDAGLADYGYGGDLAARSRLETRLRMRKCMGDGDGFLAAFASDRQWVLARLWLEFQAGGRPTVGTLPLEELTRSVGARELAADYRQLPESYRAMLEGWRPRAPAE